MKMNIFRVLFTLLTLLIVTPAHAQTHDYAVDHNAAAIVRIQAGLKAIVDGFRVQTTEALKTEIQALVKTTAEIKAADADQAKQIAELRRLGSGIHQCLNPPTGTAPQVQEKCLEEVRQALVTSHRFSGVDHNAVVHEGRVVVERTANHLVTQALTAENGGGSFWYQEDPATGKVSLYYKPPERNPRMERRLEQAVIAEARAQAQADASRGLSDVAYVGIVGAGAGIGLGVGCSTGYIAGFDRMVDTNGAIYDGNRGITTAIGCASGFVVGTIGGFILAQVVDD